AARFAAAGFRSEAFLASYGLAEATLLVTGGRLGHGIPARSVNEAALGKHRIEDGTDVALMSCGHPQPDHIVSIMDPQTGEPLAEDRVGEIWISGPSVAQGYWRKPRQTAEVFVERDGGRWLRSGDLGFMCQGELFVTGRIKDMLIVRGQNLYPQDVERTIEEKVEAVRKGRVAVFSVEHAGHEGIGVAAEVGRRSGVRQSLDELIQQLRQAVAEAHQEAPCVIALLNPGALPKTSSGKLQRSACRTQLEAGTLDVAAVFREGDVIEPTTAGGVPLTQRVATLWSKVLRTGAIAPSENFFARGGNSVLAAQMVAEIRDELGIELDLNTLFTVQTLAEFTLAVEQAIAQQRPTTRGFPLAARERELPLAPAQESFWLMWQLDPHSVAYNIPGGLRLRGDLDSAALQASFATLIARHETLRTTFYARDGRGFQRVHATSEWQLLQADLRGCPSDQREARLRSLREEEARTPFDLERGPLMRVKLIAVDDQEHLLLVTLHHIIADGWSLNVLLEELAQLYTGQVQGQPVALPALPLQYADHARWQLDHPSEAERTRQLDYWYTELAEAEEPLALPLDRPRTKATSMADRIELRLEKSLCLRLQQLAAQHEVTPFMVLLAALDVLLYRYSGHSDIRVGVPFALRDRPEIQRVVGLFVNTVVLRAKLDPRRSFSTFLAEVRETTLRAQAHRDIPFEAVSARLSSGADTPLFEVMFNHQQRDPGVLRRLPGLLADELPWHSHEAKFPLQLHSEQDWHGNIRLSFDYAVDLLERATVEHLANRYVRLLERICEHAESAVDELDVADEAELAQLAQWSRGKAAGDATLLPELLSRQAEATAQAVALVSGSGSMSYAELDSRANGLSWLLRDWGVAPEVRVGILARRSTEVMLALLSVVKAGGAYVPLDPDYPDDRLEQMIRGSNVRVLIGEAHRLASLNVPGNVLVKDIQRLNDVSYMRTAAPTQLHPDNLAYVIHTSGSTGQPKGVGVTYGALAARLAWMRAEYGFDARDVFLQKTPLSFDVSVWECFLPLICGSRVVLAGPDEHRDPRRLVQLVRDHGVTTIHFVPPMWQQFIDEPDAGTCHSLRHVFSGGE
ncbi:MAG TPA: condensation domain-containing protein, partial [Steroidobacter sp.]|nr:condensation domain-containing protein [Steroidobacter sp.]